MDFLKVVMWVGERQNGLLENCLRFDKKMLGAGQNIGSLTASL